MLVESTKQKPIVALDFDGVICDSIDECLQVAFSAYQAWEDGMESAVPSFVQLPPTFLSYFRAHRYLVRPAQEYWLLVHGFHEGMLPLAPSQFRELSVSHKKELDEFEPIYFRTREVIQAFDTSAWFKLYRVYEEFADAWPCLRMQADVHIVTTRDLSSLRLLLKEFSIDVPLPRLWTKERTATKADAMVSIAKQADVPCSSISFVDDHPDHLRDVSTSGAPVYWASWGYWPASLAEPASWYERLQTLADLPVLKQAGAHV